MAEDLARFPFNPEPDSITCGHFRVIERGDLQSEEDFHELIQMLFFEPECPIYYYSEKGLPIDNVLHEARDRRDILMNKTELRYYRYPNSEHSYIRIVGEDSDYASSDRQREIVERGPEFVRIQLELSPRKRTELEAWQKVQLEDIFRQQALKKNYQYDIFLSYSDRDDREAQTLHGAINQAGGRVFMAPKSLLPGDDFAEEIRKALEGSREVWVLMSPHSIKSEWVISEWGAAWVLQKRIVPILHRCAPESLPDRLRKLQCIDMHRHMELVAQTFKKTD